MKNAVQSGKVLDMVAPGGGVVAGSLYQFGEFIGVAVTDAAAGESFGLAVEGVYDLDKNTGGTFTFAVGDECYLDDATGKVSNDADTGNHPKVGDVLESRVDGDATVKVKLNRASHK